MAVLKPLHGRDYYLWKYVPSQPAAIVFAILFLVATLAHSWRIYKARARFCIAFAIGGLCRFQIFNRY